MIFSKPQPFISAFVDEIDEALRERDRQCRGLSNKQKYWISFCMMATIMTNSICWAQFERAGLGHYSLGALAWMFRWSKIPWEWLFQMSVRVVFQRHGITGGTLIIDDSDKRRAKVTKRIAHVHKLKDKASGGFLFGQNMVFLLLVSDTVTIPVGFAFYRPDPARTAWTKENKALKKRGIPKRDRPSEPHRTPAYPTKVELALRHLTEFKQWHTTVVVKAVLADALYGAADFVDRASAIFDGTQVVSQLRKNQTVNFRGRLLSVKEFFRRYPGIPVRLKIRGGEEVAAIVSSARVFVCSHGVKRFVIAIKYDGEDEYRYLLASDLS